MQCQCSVSPVAFFWLFFWQTKCQIVVHADFVGLCISLPRLKMQNVFYTLIFFLVFHYQSLENFLYLVFHVLSHRHFNHFNFTLVDSCKIYCVYSLQIKSSWFLSISVQHIYKCNRQKQGQGKQLFMSHFYSGFEFTNESKKLFIWN